MSSPFAQSSTYVSSCLAVHVIIFCLHEPLLHLTKVFELELSSIKLFALMRLLYTQSFFHVAYRAPPRVHAHQGTERHVHKRAFASNAGHDLGVDILSRSFSSG